MHHGQHAEMHGVRQPLQFGAVPDWQCQGLLGRQSHLYQYVPDTHWIIVFIIGYYCYIMNSVIVICTIIILLLSPLAPRTNFALATYPTLLSTLHRNMSSQSWSRGLGQPKSPASLRISNALDCMLAYAMCPHCCVECKGLFGRQGHLHQYRSDARLMACLYAHCALNDL